MLPDCLLEQAPRFELQAGALTPIGPHSTGWRVLPALLIANFRTGSALLSFSGQAALPVRSGACVLVLPGVRHRIEQLAPRAVSRWVHVNFYLMGSFDLFRYYSLPAVLPPRRARVLGDSIAAWYEESAGLPPEPSLLRRVKEGKFGLQLLELLLPSLTLRTARSAQDPVRDAQALATLRPLLERMEREFACPWQRNDLAQAAHLSPAQFHRLFRRATGMTPMEYRSRLRLRRAQHLLLTTTAAVKEIARQVGYEDAFVFSKAFKRTFLVSPLAYRARMQNQPL